MSEQLVIAQHQKMNDLDPPLPLGAALNADLKRIYLRSTKLIEEEQDLAHLIAHALQIERELNSHELANTLGTANKKQEPQQAKF